MLISAPGLSVLHNNMSVIPLTGDTDGLISYPLFTLPLVKCWSSAKRLAKGSRMKDRGGVDGEADTEHDMGISEHQAAD